MTPPQTPTTRWTQDPGGAAAAGGGAGRTKPIIPTFAGNNIFDISSLTQEFIDSFLGYCLHARIARDKRLKNLTQDPNPKNASNGRSQARRSGGGGSSNGSSNNNARNSSSSNSGRSGGSNSSNSQSSLQRCQ